MNWMYLMWLPAAMLSGMLVGALISIATNLHHIAHMLDILAKVQP